MFIDEMSHSTKSRMRPIVVSSKWFSTNCCAYISFDLMCLDSDSTIATLLGRLLLWQTSCQMLVLAKSEDSIKCYGGIPFSFVFAFLSGAYFKFFDSRTPSLKWISILSCVFKCICLCEIVQCLPITTEFELHVLLAHWG